MTAGRRFPVRRLPSKERQCGDVSNGRTRNAEESLRDPFAERPLVEPGVNSASVADALPIHQHGIYVKCQLASKFCGADECNHVEIVPAKSTLCQESCHLLDCMQERTALPD